MGAYAGYTTENYAALLNTLAKITGKFMLSSYPNDYLAKSVLKNNWHMQEIRMKQSMRDSQNKRPEKTELLVTNYLTDNLFS